MFKTITAFLMVFTLLAVQTTASAASLGDTLSSLTGTTVDTAGVDSYRTGARTYTTLGGVHARFGTKSLQLLTIDPPRYSAGCNGIDMHFGGFSFISGAEIQALVQAVMKNAVGLVIDLAINTLCPTCHTVLEGMRRLATLARQMAMGSCEAAKALVGAITQIPAVRDGLNSVNSAMGGDGKVIKEADESKANKQEDLWTMFEGIVDDLGNLPEASDKIQGINKMMDRFGAAIDAAAASYDGNSATGKISSGVFNKAEYSANLTDVIMIHSLGMLSPTQRMILQSTTGVVIRTRKTEEEMKAEKDKGGFKVHVVAATITGAQAVCLMKYGFQGIPKEAWQGNAAPPSSSQCPAPQDLTYLVCKSATVQEGSASKNYPALGTPNATGCYEVESVKGAEAFSKTAALASSQAITDINVTDGSEGVPLGLQYTTGNGVNASTIGGFYGMIKAGLSSAIAKAGTSNGKLTDEERRVINAISTMSPVPVYRLVNAAVVYPDVAKGLLDAYADSLAGVLAQGYIRHLMNNQRSAISGSTEMPDAIAAYQQALIETLHAVDSTVAASVKDLNAVNEQWNAFNAQLDGVQNMVKRQVGVMGLSGATRWADKFANDAVKQ